MESKFKIIMKNDLTYYINLITRYFAGEADAGEITELTGWLKSSPENQKQFEEYQKTWQAVEYNKIDTAINVDNEWSSLQSKIKTASVKEEKKVEVFTLKPYQEPGYSFFHLYRYKALRIAAVFILLAGFSFVIYHYLNRTETKQLFAQTEAIESKLPDGTSVTLNAGASLEYPEKFSGNKRKVSLKGEAYFDVIHDESKPFIISADGVDVEVLGTSFYIDADTAGGNVEVILTSGRVAMYRKDKPSDRIILEPGEKARFSKNEHKFLKSVNEDKNYMAWKTKMLVFNDTPLGDVIRDINAIYRSNISLKNDKIAGCLVTTTIDANKCTIDCALDILNATLKITINKSASGIEISGNGCR